MVNNSAEGSEMPDCRKCLFNLVCSVCFFIVANSGLSLLDISFEAFKFIFLLIIFKAFVRIYVKDRKIQSQKISIYKAAKNTEEINQDIIDEILYGQIEISELEERFGKEHAFIIRKLYLEKIEDKCLKCLAMPLEHFTGSQYPTNMVIGYLDSPVIYAGNLLINSLSYPIFTTVNFSKNLEFFAKASKLISSCNGVNVNTFFNSNSTGVQNNSINCSAEILIPNSILKDEFKLTSHKISETCFKQLWQSPSIGSSQCFMAKEIITEIYQSLNLNIAKSMDSFSTQTIAIHECSQDHDSKSKSCVDKNLKLTCTIPNLRLMAEEPDRPQLNHVQTILNFYKCQNIAGMPNKMNLHLAKIVCGAVLACELSVLLKIC